MADYTQAQITLLSHQNLTHPDKVVGSGQTVATFLSCRVFAWLADIETTANATAPSLLIQGCPDADGNNWVTIAKLEGPTTASESEVLTAVEPIGETVMAMASTTNLAVGDKIYIAKAAGVASSEWGEIVAVATNVSVTVMDGLISAVAINDVMYDQAMSWEFEINLGGIVRLRAVLVHQAATGSDLRVMVVAECATDLE